MQLTRSALMIAISLSLLGLGGSAAKAASINYGDFSGTSVMYLDVTETANTPGDEEPLFGGPSITGDTLDFDPMGFSASASSGSSDLTDGQLNFTLMGRGRVLSSILLTERGDYNLIGTGSAATQISYAVGIGSITVLEVDGAALATPVSLGGASASGSDDLSGGTEMLAPWDLSLSYDVNAALTDAGVSFVNGATKLEIAIDNTLAAISESASIAFIAKKDFAINVGTVVPEPASAALVGLGLLVLGVAGRRARS